MCIGLTIEYIPDMETTYFEFYLDDDIVETHKSKSLFKFDSPVVESQSIGAQISPDDSSPVSGFQGYIWQMTLYSFKLGWD